MANREWKAQLKKSSSSRSSKKKFYKATKGAGEKLSRYIQPMLAKETDTPFDNGDWLFEIKWDGYRAISEIKNGEVKLYSRNGNSFLGSYPPVVDALAKIRHNVVLDGEIVVLNEDGVSDFQKLQHYEDNTQYPLCYYIFDVLFIDGKKTTALPLIERKQLVRKIIPKSAVLKYSDHIIGKGKDFFAAAQQQDLEGIMAKKADSEYHEGTRTNEWLKIKHHKSDEVIVVGFTEPTGSRPYFGALVLAVRSKDGLKYAGHTGTGFDDATLKEVYAKLKKIIVKESPFKERVKTNMPVTWVKPKYIAEIKFTQWTTDGKMRHPVFLRMREEKSIKDAAMVTSKKITKTAIKKPADSKKDNDAEEMIFGKNKVKITHRDKIYWPDEKITKGMMIDYYQQMADYVLPYLKDRPESLKRDPNGINGKGFFHKDAGEEAPKFVKSIPVFSESANKEINYIICNDKATLAYLNNLGCIELNPWNSTTQKLDNPDYLIIDIDPSEKNNFEQVIETALAFKKVLDKAGAACFCKTSGATGLHIFLPMEKKYSYEQVKDFAAILCTIVNEMLPKFTSMERSLSKRGKDKIYLDHLQNRRGQTLACAYSLRPKKGATVSTPLQWKEVKKGLHPSQFHINNIYQRVQKIGDIFKGVFGKAIDIKKCLEKLSV
jgi:bifunctional non-homologous end joining protein LigD